MLFSFLNNTIKAIHTCVINFCTLCPCYFVRTHLFYLFLFPFELTEWAFSSSSLARQWPFAVTAAVGERWQPMELSVSTPVTYVLFILSRIYSIDKIKWWCNVCLCVCELLCRYAIRYRAQQALLHTFITSQFDFDFVLVEELTSFKRTDQWHGPRLQLSFDSALHTISILTVSVGKKVCWMSNDQACISV